MTTPTDRTQFTGEIMERMLELGQKASVRIDTTAKGQAQIKVSVCEGTTSEEMERLSALAHKTYVDLQVSLGRIAQF